jgi:hypothetical protein
VTWLCLASFAYVLLVTCLCFGYVLMVSFGYVLLVTFAYDLLVFWLCFAGDFCL